MGNKRRKSVNDAVQANTAVAPKGRSKTAIAVSKEIVPTDDAAAPEPKTRGKRKFDVDASSDEPSLSEGPATKRSAVKKVRAVVDSPKAESEDLASVAIVPAPARKGAAAFTSSLAVMEVEVEHPPKLTRKRKADIEIPLSDLPTAHEPKGGRRGRKIARTSEHDVTDPGSSSASTGGAFSGVASHTPATAGERKVKGKKVVPQEPEVEPDKELQLEKGGRRKTAKSGAQLSE
ncbi:hypothetical protein HDU93_006762, partial [Gonapodya sp. JEL0774]